MGDVLLGGEGICHPFPIIRASFTCQGNVEVIKSWWKLAALALAYHLFFGGAKPHYERFFSSS